MFRPGDSFYGEFTTANPSTGAAANADSLPVATANHNGSDDASFVLTVANIDTGRYKITGTVPGGYAKGDVVNITVAATCSGVAGKARVDGFTIDSKRVGDLNDSPYNGGAVVSVTAPVTVGTNSDKTGYTLGSFGFTVAPTASANASAVVSAMASSPVGSVANLTGITLDPATVSASASPTASVFTVSGLPSGLASGDLTGMSLIFQTGNRTGARRTVLTHVRTGGVDTITLSAALGAAPAVGDTLVFC